MFKLSPLYIECNPAKINCERHFISFENWLKVFSQPDGLGLGEEGELKVQMINKPQMLIEVQMLNLALLPLFRQTLVGGWLIYSPLYYYLNPLCLKTKVSIMSERNMYIVELFKSVKKYCLSVLPISLRVSLLNELVFGIAFWLIVYLYLRFC